MEKITTDNIDTFIDDTKEISLALVQWFRSQNIDPETAMLVMMYMQAGYVSVKKNKKRGIKRIAAVIQEMTHLFER